MHSVKPDQRSSAEQESSRAHASNDKEAVLSAQPWRIRRSLWVFWLMFAINALNYLDRLIVVAVGPTLKAEFHLHDRAIGMLSSAFVLVYTLAAVPLGLLADLRISRAKVVAFGVAVWSFMSGASAFAVGFPSLLVTRGLVGVGEASYYPAGTALLSSYYPLEQRARVMSRWQAGQIVGIALAFGLGALFLALFPASLAWRLAFLVTGLPGLALAALMWFVDDAPQQPIHPVASQHGDSATHGMTTQPSTRSARFSGEDIRAQLRAAKRHIAQVIRIRTIWLVVALQACTFLITTPAITFLPIYIRSPHGPFHLGASQAALVAGALIVGGGFCGTLLGGNVADWLGKYYIGGRILAAGAGFALALPCFAVMLLTHSLPIFLVTGICAVLALNLQSGPLTAATQDATPPALRATAVAVTLLLSHVLSDVWSSTVVGALSTTLHERSGTALLIIGCPTLLAGAIIAIVGARFYARDAHH